MQIAAFVCRDCKSVSPVDHWLPDNEPLFTLQDDLDPDEAEVFCHACGAEYKWRCELNVFQIESERVLRNMSRESEYQQIALAFVSDARDPQTSFEFAGELEAVGMHGGRVPKARADVWLKVINQLIADGKLIDTVDGIRAPVVAEQPKQLTLF